MCCFGHGEAVDAECRLQVRVINDDGLGGLIAKKEGLEDGPVFDGVAVAGAVEDTVETMGEDEKGRLLRGLAGTTGRRGGRVGGGGREAVVTLGLGEFGEQCEVRAKAGQCLQEAAEAPAGGVYDAVVSLRI